MKIGVITPVFNAKKHIGDCIGSVAVSVIQPYELSHLVIDDCSSDGTWEEIRNQPNNILAFRLEEHKGAAYARNFGVSKTDAELLYCLDGDDVIFQNTLRLMASFLEKHSYDWVYGDFLRTDSSLKYLSGQDYYGYKFSDPSEVLTSMFSGEHFFQQNCLYRRKVFDLVGGFDESRANFQDFDLFTRFLLAGFMPHYLPGPGYLHRIHDQSMSVVNGRQTNFELHKGDVRDLYSKLESQINAVLNQKQLKKITSWLSHN